MKITLVGTAYPLRGGIAHYNTLLADALRARHQVNIVTFKRQYPSFLFPGTTQDEADTGYHGPAAPQIIDSMNPLNWLFVGRSLRENNPDLLIFKYWLPFFGPCFGTIARTAKRGTTTQVLFICDNVIPHERRPGDTVFTRYAFRAVDYFIVQSAAVEKDLLAFWPGARYRKVPHPVYSLFGPGMTKTDARAALGIRAPRMLLFFGYVRAYKGLRVLIDAIAALGAESGIHLLVAGEFYDDEQSYREQIQRLHLGDRVTVHARYVGNDQVAAYFSAADAVVLPYIAATQSGIAQIAFNYDRPVIATVVGGLAEVVTDGHTGYLVPPNDAAGMADAIKRFYSEGAEIRLAENIRREKQRYSWGAMTDAIEALTGVPASSVKSGGGTGAGGME